jgi:hypothetical protein
MTKEEYVEEFDDDPNDYALLIEQQEKEEESEPTDNDLEKL